jgi:hypothetical protein
MSMKARSWMAMVTSALTIMTITGCSGTQSSAVPGPVAVAGVQANNKSKTHSQHDRLQVADQEVILGEYQALLEQYRDVTRRQEQQISQLEHTVTEMAETFDVLATEFESIQPRKRWHEEHLNSNRQHYSTICEFLAAVDNELFPTVNTWYAANWQRLTAPFHQERFPTVTERDQLVELIVAIQNSEQRRKVMLGKRADHDPTVGYCLTDQWNEAQSALAAFTY